MNIRRGLQLGLAVLISVAACGGAPQGTDTTDTSQTEPSEPSATSTAQDVMDIGPFAPLDPGTYFIDPDLDLSTPLRVVYEIPAEGWSQWIGAAKFNDDDGHVGVSIATVNNLVTDGCHDHSWADPPIGPTVNDLAAALADLPPFQVTSTPDDVTIYGYDGKYLARIVPDLPVEGVGDDLRFTGCLGGQLKSWVAPHDTTEGDAFYGYTGPGYSEEYWILDVEGTRLMIMAGGSPGAPSEDLAELSAILDSIRIEP
ncbi:MAG TPA: hypothetical protein VHM29_08325 [Acidimicrobiia bacterium]|nr:hypothetical protein [Acidimicrobiia bacterium]